MFKAGEIERELNVDFFSMSLINVVINKKFRYEPAM